MVFIGGQPTQNKAGWDVCMPSRLGRVHAGYKENRA
jgi:hypothetical protein